MKTTLIFLTILLTSCASPKGIIQNKYYVEPRFEMVMALGDNPNPFNPHPVVQPIATILPEEYRVVIGSKTYTVTEQDFERAKVGEYFERR